MIDYKKKQESKGIFFDTAKEAADAAGAVWPVSLTCLKYTLIAYPTFFIFPIPKC